MHQSSGGFATSNRNRFSLSVNPPGAPASRRQVGACNFAPACGTLALPGIAHEPPSTADLQIGQLPKLPGRCRSGDQRYSASRTDFSETAPVGTENCHPLRTSKRPSVVRLDRSGYEAGVFPEPSGGGWSGKGISVSGSGWAGNGSVAVAGGGDENSTA